MEEIERAMDYAMKMAGLKVKKEQSKLPPEFSAFFFRERKGLGTRLHTQRWLQRTRSGKSSPARSMHR